MRLIGSAVLLSAILLTACSDPLQDVEAAAKASEECLENCSQYSDKLRVARLKATQAGFTKEQITASFALGKNSAVLPCVEYDLSALEALTDPYAVFDKKRPLCK